MRDGPGVPGPVRGRASVVVVAVTAQAASVVSGSSDSGGEASLRLKTISGDISIVRGAVPAGVA